MSTNYERLPPPDVTPHSLRGLCMLAAHIPAQVSSHVHFATHTHKAPALPTPLLICLARLKPSMSSFCFVFALLSSPRRSRNLVPSPKPCAKHPLPVLPYRRTPIVVHSPLSQQPSAYCACAPASTRQLASQLAWAPPGPLCWPHPAPFGGGKKGHCLSHCHAFDANPRNKSHAASDL